MMKPQSAEWVISISVQILIYYGIEDLGAIQVLCNADGGEGGGV